MPKKPRPQAFDVTWENYPLTNQLLDKFLKLILKPGDFAPLNKQSIEEIRKIIKKNVLKFSNVTTKKITKKAVIKKPFRKQKIIKCLDCHKTEKIVDILVDKLSSLRRIFLRDKLIVNTGQVRRHIKDILSTYKEVAEKRDSLDAILLLSEKYDYPPLAFLRILLKEYYKWHKKRIQNAFKAPEKHMPRDVYILYKQLEMFDDISDTSPERQKMIIEAANKFEQDVYAYLRKNKIKFFTQEELAEHQKKEFGRAIITPDVLLIDEVYINGHRVVWIDCKNYFFTEDLKYMKHEIAKQAKKYTDTFGPGALLFRYGFTKDSAIGHTLLLDGTSLFF